MGKAGVSRLDSAGVIVLTGTDIKNEAFLATQFTEFIYLDSVSCLLIALASNITEPIVRTTYL